MNEPFRRRRRRRPAPSTAGSSRPPAAAPRSRAQAEGRVRHVKVGPVGELHVGDAVALGPHRRGARPGVGVAVGGLDHDTVHQRPRELRHEVPVPVELVRTVVGLRERGHVRWGGGRARGAVDPRAGRRRCESAGGGRCRLSAAGEPTVDADRAGLDQQVGLVDIDADRACHAQRRGTCLQRHEWCTGGDIADLAVHSHSLRLRPVDPLRDHRDADQRGRCPVSSCRRRAVARREGSLPAWVSRRG